VIDNSSRGRKRMGKGSSKEKHFAEVKILSERSSTIRVRKAGRNFAETQKVSIII